MRIRGPGIVKVVHICSNNFSIFEKEFKALYYVNSLHVSMNLWYYHVKMTVSTYFKNITNTHWGSLVDAEKFTDKTFGKTYTIIYPPSGIHPFFTLERAVDVWYTTLWISCCKPQFGVVAVICDFLLSTRFYFLELDTERLERLDKLVVTKLRIYHNV